MEDDIAEDLHLTAMNLRGRKGYDMSENESEGQASVEEEVEEGQLNVHEHKQRNAAVFQETFPITRLTTEGLIGLVEWARPGQPTNFKRLYASYITKYNCMHPDIYRPGRLFRDGSMERFIRLCRFKRGEDPNDWQNDLDRPVVEEALLEENLIDPFGHF